VNKVANAERVHIAIAGRRNVGKSSLINMLTGQELSIVSEVAGTTTDPVKKAIELLPYGPVVIVDTAGIDDEGELGEKRISRTIKAISSADFAIIVVDAREKLTIEEKQLFEYLDKISVNYLVVVNKIEFGVSPELLSELKKLNVTHFEVSCKEKIGFETIKAEIICALPQEPDKQLIGDLLKKGDVVVLVVPIDPGAPKGRIIKPQAHALREALDENTISIVVQHTELREALSSLKNPPDLVVTDSQAIMKVAADVPEGIKVTTFSILMARLKGDLPIFVNGLKKVEELQNGDNIFIAEACTHHAQKDDIGTIKIPKWLREHTGKELKIDIAHGLDFPQNITDYKLIIHCGGCMLTRKSMQIRLKQARMMDIPIVNYGILISYLHGAIPRALEPFEEAISEWNRARLQKV
jgi:[FeFe] hydrogenase H-cluster maturation GTPase HydF